jgi:hypothetical protein
MKNNFKEIYKMPNPTCLYKWGWSTVHLQSGSTCSCHRTENDNVNYVNFDDFHNTPAKLKARQAMLDGKWPGGGCEYCKKIEDAGGISDRTDINRDARAELIPPELLTNPNAIRITPTMVEIYFSNLCNMSCIYCNPKYSSTWEHEARKYNLYPVSKLDRITGDKDSYQKILAKFWEWLDKNASNLVRYNILGGEPFYQPELETNITFFETHPCPNLRLTVFSNLKVSHDKFVRILTQLNSLLDRGHLASVQITCSLDCWGPQQEYVRTGLDLVQWEKNFDTLVKEFQRINVQVHGTMTSLTIKTMPGLVKKINDINQYRTGKSIPAFLTYNMVFDPPHMNPDIFPNGLFDTDFDEVINLLTDSHTKNLIQGYKQSINNGKHNPDLIDKLKIYLDELDARRGTNWKPLFPWLVEHK